MLKNNHKIILFDLDGTILDTASGIYNTLEFLSKKYNFKLKSLKSLKSYMGDGLLELILKNGCEKSLALSIADEGFEHYKKFAKNYTSFFDKMETLLEKLDCYGIVTNKSRALTEAVQNKIPNFNSCKSVVCGDDLKVKKPDPLPLLYCLSEVNKNTQNSIDPSEVIYVGDNIRDIQAANKAGMTSCVAKYGYVSGDWKDWGFDIFISSPKDLSKYLEQ